MKRLGALGVLVLSIFAARSSRAYEAELRVGSKRFTESYVLGEIVREVAARGGEAVAVHKQGLGNTGIVFAALKSGSIDIYPEYTGTIARELLENKAETDLDDLNRALAPMGLEAGIPLGFNDTYALAVREEDARTLALVSMSDLAMHPQLRFGLSQEFIERSDGWPAVQSAYHLPVARPRGLDHGLAFEAIASDQIDVTDIYSTDAKVEKYRLTILTDDRRVFPRYEAVLLYRRDLPTRLPRTWEKIALLRGRISGADMTKMNADAELRAESFRDIATRYVAHQPAYADGQPLGANISEPTPFVRRLFGPDFLRLTAEHVTLVLLSLALGVVAGVPLGVWAAHRPRAAKLILGSVGVIQTIPSLALLAFLIPVFRRIGFVPALAALFLYSLLPIVRNTYTGLTDIAPSLRESAIALGLPRLGRLRLIELPLASRSILAGIKTSAVISVGTATIAAFIGAGGYGERIASGLALNDHQMLLAGAAPAAALALVAEAAFGWLEKLLIPRGLRLSP